MEIKLEPEISLKEYQMLRGTTSWAKLTDRQVKKLLKHSAFKVRAKADGKTVGMARIIFDYGYTAYVSDVIVLADFQGHGIGKMMMEDLTLKYVNDSDNGQTLLYGISAQHLEVVQNVLAEKYKVEFIKKSNLFPTS